MKQHEYKSSWESSDSSESRDALAGQVDNDWLEAILDNLALANLRRSDCVELIEHLEDCERRNPAAVQINADNLNATRLVGDHFESEFNDCDMRSPGAMTGENVIETLERAIRGLGSRGYASAVHQIIFFVSNNLDEVVTDSEDDEPTVRIKVLLDF